MALPFLPGNSFNPRLGKEKFHLSHHFDCNNEIPMWVGERKPDVGGETRLGQDTRKMHSQIPAGTKRKRDRGKMEVKIYLAV